MKPVLPEKAWHIPVKAFGLSRPVCNFAWYQDLARMHRMFSLVENGQKLVNLVVGFWASRRSCRRAVYVKVGCPFVLSTKRVIFLARPQHGIRALEKWQLCRQTAASEMMFDQSPSQVMVLLEREPRRGASMGDSTKQDS